MSVAKPLRIALIQTQAENAGAQEISRLLSGGLQARGHEVRQIFFFRRTASFDDVPNAVSCCPERPSGPIGMVRFLLALRRELLRAKPDVVITLQHYGNIIATPVARSIGVRMVIANQVSPKKLIHPSIQWADAALGLLGAYDRIVVNSSETEADYARYPRRYRSRVSRIDHGFQDKTVAIGKREARVALGLPLEAPLLGCVARLHPAKCIDAAIRILPINRDQHLALAGQGSEQANLERLATELGVQDRIHFLGELPPERIGVLLAALDCFVFPSRVETFGLAPVEAAQAGVPVVANAIQILKEVLSVDGQPCASFVDTENSEAFAAAVRRVFADPQTTGMLTANGRRLAERYPLHAMVDEYASLIEALANETTCVSKSASTAPASGAGTRF